MSDEVWQTVAPIDAFVQREPDEGGEPSQRTEFRVAYDATTLYVRVRAFDTEPDKIVSYLTRRDDDSPSDWIRVLIDSYHDRRTAYEFARQPGRRQAGPLLVQRQQQRRQLGRGVGRQASRATPSGWSAEFRIPFSQLRFTPGGSNHVRLRGRRGRLAA